MTRNRLHAGSALGTVAAIIAVAPEYAQAQAFQGTPTVVSGSATINGSVPNTHTITLNSDQTIINWVPTDTGIGGPPIAFLTSTGTVNYVPNGSLSVGPFAVLNRILPTDATRAISLDGTINSPAGGSIWFYSPGGILAGSNARFNIGSLVLTTGDPAVSLGNFISGTGQFSIQAAAQNSEINIAAGAQINALNPGSYVVAVAPRINHAGSIAVNGSAALVAAEAVDFTYNSGLFDITVTQQAQNAAFNSSGSIGGPASTNVQPSFTGDYHRIYMVAAPANNLFTMFVTAQNGLGFDVAGAAAAEDNAVILSAGHNVAEATFFSNFNTTPTDPFVNSSNSTGRGNIQLSDGTVKSALNMRATNQAYVPVGGGFGPLSFAFSLSMQGDQSALLLADGGVNNPSLTVAGALRVASDSFSVVDDGISRTGGNATIRVLAGGQINVTGFTDLSAIGSGGNNAIVGGVAGNGTGGTVLLDVATGGNATFSGDLQLDTSGRGGDSLVSGTAGNGQAGSATINSGGTLTARYFEFDSDGFGGSVLAPNNGAAGNGTGGSSQFTVSGGTTTILDGGTVDATGSGGFGNTGGVGRGGTARVTVSGGQLLLPGLDGLEIDATAEGGDGLTGNGGDAFGGTSVLTVQGGTFVADQTVVVTADSNGGAATNGTAGNSQGGDSSIIMTSGTGSINIGGLTSVTANANAGLTRGTNLASGGNAVVAASTAGTIALNGGATVSADGFGSVNNGPSGTAGNAQGGDARILSTNGGLVSVTGAATVRAVGSAATNNTTGTDGGNGTAGNLAIFAAAGGAINISGNATVTGTAVGGNNAGGADLIGGNAVGATFAQIASQDAGSSVTVGGNATIDANAVGGGSTSAGGAGGIGTGGTSALGANNSAVTINGTVTLLGEGTGGQGTNGANGGAAQGGSVSSIPVNNGIVRFNGTSATYSARAVGGAGLNGGNATGGGAQISPRTGAQLLAAGSVSIDASGNGGAGSTGNGGIAQGGNAQIFASGGTVSVGTTANVNGRGNGGTGRNGGNGTGGQANILVGGGSVSVSGTSTVSATGTGGAATAGLGGTGGNGRGGTSAAVVSNPALGGSLTLADVNQGANGIGGAGGSVNLAIFPTGTLGGRGGDGTGGTARLGSSSSAGTLSFGTVQIQAAGQGGNGGASSPTSTGGRGGDGFGGQASIGFDSAASSLTGTASYTATTAVANGIGGIGGNSGTGGTGGGGGNGIGGFASFGSSVGGANTVTGIVSVQALGVGHVGGSATVAGATGTGVGGNAVIGVGTNPNVGGASSVSAGSLSASADGLRLALGPAGFVSAPTGLYGRAIIIGNGGNILAGSATLSARGAAVSPIAPIPGLINSGIGFTNGSLTITGNVNGTFSGNAALGVQNGSIATGQLNYQVGGNLVQSVAGTANTNPGTVTSSAGMNFNVTGNISTPVNLTAAGQIVALAGGGIGFGNVAAGGIIDLEANGDISVGTVTGGDFISFDTFGNVTTGNIRGEDDVEFDVGGNIVAGNISVADSVTGQAGGTIQVGNVDAGRLNPSTDPTAAYGVGFAANGSVTTGTISAAGQIGAASATSSVTLGNVTGDRSLLVLARTGVNLGSVATAPIVSGTNGITYIANSSMFSLINPVTLDPAPVFAANPVALAGPVSISGPVSTGRFVSASTGSFAAQANVTVSQSLLVRTGTGATFNGLVSAPTITVRSSDLTLGANASLGSATTQALTLEMVNANGVSIGGAAGNGYAIDQAEASRIRAQQATLVALGAGTAPPGPVTLGAMTLQGGGSPQANIVGPNGAFTIQTAGVLRINGAVEVNNAVPGTTLNINAGQQILIDTSAGGAVRMSGATPTTLGGSLRMSAPDIWAASSSVLGQLAQSASFAGRNALLNEAPATSLAAPVLAANSLSFQIGNSLLIQNTGTPQLKSGFRAGSISITGTGPSTTPLDIVINGVALNQAGLELTNNDTIEALIITGSRSASGESTINGCFIAIGECPAEAGPANVAAVQASTEPEAIAERTEEERRRVARAVAEGEKRPEVVMQSLVDTGAADDSDLINEPVSGAGNPGLWDGAQGEGAPQ